MLRVFVMAMVHQFVCYSLPFVLIADISGDSGVSSLRASSLTCYHIVKSSANDGVQECGIYARRICCESS